MVDMGNSSQEPTEEDKICAMCSECDVTPSFWEELKEDVVEGAKELMKGEPKTTDSWNEYHKAAFRAYVSERFGYLGASNRLCLPDCIVRGICAHWLDLEGKYMGFQKSTDDTVASIAGSS